MGIRRLSWGCVFACLSLIVGAITAENECSSDEVSKTGVTLELEGEWVRGLGGIVEIFDELQTGAGRGLAASCLLAIASPLKVREFIDGENKPLAVLFSWSLVQRRAFMQMAECSPDGSITTQVKVEAADSYAQCDRFFERVRKAVECELPERWKSLVMNYEFFDTGMLIRERTGVTGREVGVSGKSEYSRIVDNSSLKAIVPKEGRILKLDGVSLPERTLIYAFSAFDDNCLVLSDAVPKYSGRGYDLGLCELVLVDNVGNVVWDHCCEFWEFSEITCPFRYADFVLSKDRSEIIVFFASDTTFGIDVVDATTGLTKWDFHSCNPLVLP